MDNKLFSEVFTDLDLDKKIKLLTDDCLILRLSENKTGDLARIFIESDHLISGQALDKAANEIRKHYFNNYKSVEIIPSFALSDVYNMMAVWNEYSETVEYELKKKSAILHSLLSRSDISFVSPDEMEINIENGIVGEEMLERFKKAIDVLFVNRCNLKGTVNYGFLPSINMEIKNEFNHKVDVIVQEYTLKHSSRKVVSEDDEMLGGEDNKKEHVKKDKEESPNKESFGDKKESYFKKKEYSASSKKFINSDNPDVLFGTDCNGTFFDIVDITDEVGQVCIKGRVIYYEDKLIKGDRHILLFNMYDGTDSISCKWMLYPENYDQGKGVFKEGSEIMIMGTVERDTYAGNELVISRIRSIQKYASTKISRMDTALKKRVELHLHTRFSEMDGISKEENLVNTVAKWGWPAVAVTDHGIVQALPKVDHILRDKRTYPEKPFKLICGMEGYLVDDDFDAVVNCHDETLADSFVVFDIVTTGLSAYKHKILELGAVKIVNGSKKTTFSSLIYTPNSPIPYEVEQETGIHDIDLQNAPTLEEVLPRFIEFCDQSVLVSFNGQYVMSFLKEACSKVGINKEFTYIDLEVLSRAMVKDANKFTIHAIGNKLKLKLDVKNRALNDADCISEIFRVFSRELLSQKILTLKEINDFAKSSPDVIRKQKAYHISILVKNETGRINLNRLVSFAHIDYYFKAPKIPRSLLVKYREGLILGSACEAGELIDAIVKEKSEKTVSDIVNFYDYLEIMPIGNNEFMKYSKKPMYANINTDEDLREINRKVVKLGEMFNKPVCATGDSHFIEPEDSIYREIIHMNKFNKKSTKPDTEESPDEKQPPLYLRTTDDMLNEFEYLGALKAEEVVITNTNMIADMCDDLSPTSNEKCPPELENSEENLRNCCYETAHKMYGPDLPKTVEDRLETELNGIIENGYAVLYMIARNLVLKSEEDGYLVGSRGSVGSSFVATMSGITEVNPLHAHYYCKNCHYSDFDSDLIKSFACMAGCDLPDMNCPNCGEKLIKAGFDIPFQTFLGFSGDKEPDIDLNFSGEYQGKAHRYTEVLFGKGHTYHAGTMSGVADKTSIAYVKDYYQSKGIYKRQCEIERIAKGVEGVRATTGQHPGGIVVLPHGREIYEFTAIQKPANDMNTDVITTHYEYHDIDKNLLKLDILGHVDPTMMRCLEDITGLNCREIPLDDKKVMSIFQTTTALGFEPNDIKGLVLGCLGIPEFGTSNTMNVLLKTKPQTFTDLIRISGLTHGTNVWNDNAETLIDEGTADITGVISTRDDIMVYLMSMGLEGKQAFPIMEKVRKGKGLLPEDEELMKEHNVPDWYIWSCKKIKYMFPKAHAAAYVTMGWRVGYYKVYYPLAYYAAYFSIRAKKFSYELMCNGLNVLRQNMNFIQSLPHPSDAEEKSLDDMKLVEEFYVRGFEFMPIDLKLVNATKFQVIDNKLMPSLTSIDGIAETAARNLVEGCKDNNFGSQAEMKRICKVGDSVIDKLVSLGIIKNLPKTDQLSLFDVY